VRGRWQCNFLTTLAGDAAVTLVYHKQLTDEWQYAAQALAARLGVSVIGRSAGKKVAWGAHCPARVMSAVRAEECAGSETALAHCL
jgi:hypothetical protein